MPGRFLTAKNESIFIQNCMVDESNNIPLEQRLKVLTELLKQNKELARTPSVSSADPIYPLHLAVATGHIPLIKLLLDNGADIDAKIQSGPLRGLTACWFAAAATFVTENWDIVTFLLQRGARWDAVAEEMLEVEGYSFNSGHRILENVVDFNQNEILKLLMERGVEINILFSLNNEPLIEGLFERLHSDFLDDYSADDLNVNLDKKLLETNITVLLLTAARQLFKIAQNNKVDGKGLNKQLNAIFDLLGTAVNSRIDDATALHVAILNNNLPVIEALVSHGADLFLTDSKGITAAVLGAKIPIVKAYTCLRYLEKAGVALEQTKMDSEKRKTTLNNIDNLFKEILSLSVNSQIKENFKKLMLYRLALALEKILPYVDVSAHIQKLFIACRDVQELQQSVYDKLLQYALLEETSKKEDSDVTMLSLGGGASHSSQDDLQKILQKAEFSIRSGKEVESSLVRALVSKLVFNGKQNQILACPTKKSDMWSKLFEEMQQQFNLLFQKFKKLSEDSSKFNIQSAKASSMPTSASVSSRSMDLSGLDGIYEEDGLASSAGSAMQPKRLAEVHATEGEKKTETETYTSETKITKEDTESPFVLAIKAEKWDLALSLVRQGLELKKLDITLENEYDTPFNRALLKHQFELALALLKAGITEFQVLPQNMQNKGWSTLTIAANSLKQIDITHQLLERGMHTKLEVPINGWPPLLVAGTYNQWNMVKLLLQYGASASKSITLQNHLVITILKSSLNAGREDIILLLLEKGVVLDTLTQEDFEYLIQTEQMQPFKIYQMLDAAKRLINKSRDMENYSKGSNREPGLFEHAEDITDEKVKKEILERKGGAEKTMTPEDFEQEKSKVLQEILPLLEILGLGLNGRVAGLTALDHAIDSKNRVMIELLVEAGASVLLEFDKRKSAKTLLRNDPFINAFSALETLKEKCNVFLRKFLVLEQDKFTEVKDSKEAKETKELNETKESKEAKETKESSDIYFVEKFDSTDRARAEEIFELARQVLAANKGLSQRSQDILVFKAGTLLDTIHRLDKEHALPDAVKREELIINTFSLVSTQSAELYSKACAKLCHYNLKHKQSGVDETDILGWAITADENFENEDLLSLTQCLWKFITCGYGEKIPFENPKSLHDMLFQLCKAYPVITAALNDQTIKLSEALRKLADNGGTDLLFSFGTKLEAKVDSSAVLVASASSESAGSAAAPSSESGVKGTKLKPSKMDLSDD